MSFHRSARQRLDAEDIFVNGKDDNVNAHTELSEIFKIIILKQFNNSSVIPPSKHHSITKIT